MIQSYEIIFNSIAASGAAAIITVLAALPVVILAIRYPRKRSQLVEHCAYVGHALPGIIIALSLVFFGIHCVPLIYQTLFLLITAYVIRFLPEAVGSIRASMLHINPRLEEAARNLGNNPGQVLRRVTLPLLKPGLLTGLALVFLTCMKELPATLLLSPP